MQKKQGTPLFANTVAMALAKYFHQDPQILHDGRPGTGESFKQE
jgi:hypothetical protein